MITQSSASIEVFSSLAKHHFVLVSVRWHERLGEPFHAQLELLCDDADIELEEYIQQSFSIRMVDRNGEDKWLSGKTLRFESAGQRQRLYVYRAHLVADLEFLKYSGGAKIFQQKSTPDIIKSIFDDHKLSAIVESRLTSSYAPREYCVQYGESDLQFIQRLMEEEGIYYYFTHAQGKSTCLLVDDPSGHSKGHGYEEIGYRDSIDLGIDEHFTKLERSKSAGVADIALTDYDYLKPRSKLLVQQHSTQSDTVGSWFEFPGHYGSVDAGQRSARIRMEASEAARLVVRLEGNVRGLHAGHVFSLSDHPSESANREYLVCDSILHAKASNLQVGNQQAFECTLSVECIPAKQTFRLPTRTARPIMRGPHSAVVCGKAGEEIWTDSYGRIKVQFPWDRLGKNNEASSCWIRVAQSSAGKNWGSMSIPRIGDEVIVEFLDGNPDRPIVTGRVYNADHMPADALTAAMNKTTFKSRSTKGGDATAFHELSFDDTKDKEVITFQSERDFKRIVENDDSLTVGFEKKSPGNRTVSVYNNETVSIGLGSGNGTYTLEAAKGILLKCGSSSIHMTPDSIEITSGKVVIKASDALQAQGGSVTVQANQSLDLKGNAGVNAQSSASFVIKGAIVQIN